MRTLPVIAVQLGVVSTKQALAAGWTYAALTRACKRGALLRVTRDHYLPETCLGDAIEARRQRARSDGLAAALAVRGSVVSHRTAALLLGLPVLRVPARPCLTVPAGRTGTAVAAHLHRGALPTDEILRAGAVAVTNPARSVVDIAREDGIEQALVVADAALARGMVRTDGLERAVTRQRGRPGVTAARALLGLCNGRAESPLESISRLRLERAGIPAADLQTTLTDQRGVFLARTDFYWPEYGVVGEADGMAKYDTVQSLVAEKMRQERLEDAGAVVVRWGWQDLDDMPRLRARLERAFARGSRIAHTERCWRVSAA